MSLYRKEGSKYNPELEILNYPINLPEPLENQHGGQSFTISHLNVYIHIETIIGHLFNYKINSTHII